MYHTVENVKPTFLLFHDNFLHFCTRSLCVNELVAIFPKFLASLRCNFIFFSNSHDTKLVAALICSVRVYHVLCTADLSQFIFAGISHTLLSVQILFWLLTLSFFRNYEAVIYFFYYTSVHSFISFPHMHCRFRYPVAFLSHRRTFLRGVQILFWATVYVLRYFLILIHKASSRRPAKAQPNFYFPKAKFS